MQSRRCRPRGFITAAFLISAAALLISAPTLAIRMVTAAHPHLVGPPRPGAKGVDAELSSRRYEADVIDRTRDQRRSVRLALVNASACLDRYAERQALAMATGERLFHQDLTPILAGCRLQEAGENVGFGYLSGGAVNQAWMQSPEHQVNLLNPAHRLIGVGACQDPDGRWYVSEVLGRPAETVVHHASDPAPKPHPSQPL